MPASKIENFSVENIESAQIGRAFAHPTRVHIFNILNENSHTRNKDLTKILKLTKSTIHSHLKKLEEAGMIQISYHQKSYLISKNSNANKILEKFNQKLTKEANFNERNPELEAFNS
jgi:predicted transcriptional regulator